jgi:hypothetical protein
MSVPQLASYFRKKGYQFIAMGEHAEDLDEAKIRTLRDQSMASSDGQFCVIPGIEFAVTRQVHIVGIGVVEAIPLDNPVSVAQRMRKAGGISVLAHPKRLGWNCPEDVLLAVDGAEIWNVGYDGKYLPSPKALPAFERMKQVNPSLLAITSHDFHRAASFYKVAIEMDVSSLSGDQIMRQLKSAAYEVRSPFFNCDANGQVSRKTARLVLGIAPHLEKIRRARSAFLRGWRT